MRANLKSSEGSLCVTLSIALFYSLISTTGYDLLFFNFFLRKEGGMQINLKGKQGVKYSVVLPVSYYKHRYSNTTLSASKSLIPLQVVINAWKFSTFQKCKD